LILKDDQSIAEIHQFVGDDGVLWLAELGELFRFPRTRYSSSSDGLAVRNETNRVRYEVRVTGFGVFFPNVHQLGHQSSKALSFQTGIFDSRRSKAKFSTHAATSIVVPTYRSISFCENRSVPQCDIGRISPRAIIL
jgi:hypothetical protein